MASEHSWRNMSVENRLVASTIDIMRHPEFALLSGVVCMGEAHVVDGLPTAATDGRDAFYGREFMDSLSMRQTRWVVLHENFHKALKHCTLYRDVNEKHPELFGLALDFVVNLMIDEMDTAQVFAERPPIPICFDEKYRGMSCIEVLRDLLQSAKSGRGSGGSAGGSAKGGTFDGHRAAPLSVEEAKVLEHAVDEAVAQGHIVARSIPGNKSANRALDKMVAERRTNWRDPLAQFFSSITEGDDYSRYCPPNKRFMALGFVMPSHFSESTGGIVIACDTSGSMGSVYPVVFGEIAQLCHNAKPEWVRILWWDTAVCGDQVFFPRNYHEIGKLLKPVGGGGTRPGCIPPYMTEKRYNPKAVVWLTDGDLDGSSTAMSIPQLWGVVDNPRFRPQQGKVLHIDSTLG